MVHKAQKHHAPLSDFFPSINSHNFWTLQFSAKIPLIREAASSFGAADELGNSPYRRLCVHVTLQTVSLRGWSLVNGNGLNHARIATWLGIPASLLHPCFAVSNGGL